MALRLIERVAGELQSSNEMVFISYSRNEFYFAESLAFTLQAKGIETWFDVHRLQPGDDWAEGIREGLRTSTMVVLVASRASLTSHYVAAEWHDALAAKKPVHVVLFESVQLPPELRDQSIYDLRTHFDRSIDMLAKGIRERQVQTSCYSRLRMHDVSVRLPLIVALVVGVAAGIALLTFMHTVFLTRGIVDKYNGIISRDDIVSYVCLMLSGSYAIYCCWSVLSRHVNWEWLRPFFIVAPFLIVPPLQNSLITLLHNWLAVVHLVGILIITLLSGSVWFVMGRSAAMLRWLPVGEAPQALRQRVNKNRVKKSPVSLARPHIQTHRERQTCEVFKVYRDGPEDENTLRELPMQCARQVAERRRHALAITKL